MATAASPQPPPIMEEPEYVEDELGEETSERQSEIPKFYCGDYEKLAQTGDDRSESGPREFLRPPVVICPHPCHGPELCDSFSDSLGSSWPRTSHDGVPRSSPSPSCPPPPRYCVEFARQDSKLASVSFNMSDTGEDEPDDATTAPTGSKEESLTTSVRRMSLEGSRCASAVRMSMCLLTVACCLAGLVLTVLGGIEQNRQCTASGCILLLSGVGLGVHFCIGSSTARPRPDFLRIISETATKRTLMSEDDGQTSAPAGGSQISSGGSVGGDRPVTNVEVIRVVTVPPPPMRKRSSSIWQAARRMSMIQDPSHLSQSRHHHIRSFHAPHIHRQRLRSFGDFDRYEHGDDRYL